MEEAICSSNPTHIPPWNPPPQITVVPPCTTPFLPVTEDLVNFKHKLKQLETVMFSDLYEDLVGNGGIELQDMEIWKEMVEGVPKRDLKQSPENQSNASELTC
ncbi:unnamed protein product [Lactuca virosa]|uniref:Uncharacterized protein n=1 Tax=Lactuca virosa TaxID=75947 RepID=A0AAU9MFH1_9ASTR|nr:unnamed protein product [Lactuca virosa]